MTDHFKNFKGFGILPGCTYETVYQLTPAQTTVQLLTQHKGKLIEIDDGEQLKEIIVPESLDWLLEDNPDYITIDFPKDYIPLYILQKIVIGTQCVTQVERRDFKHPLIEQKYK